MSEQFDRLEPEAVARSDRFVDALAAGTPVDGDPRDQALAGLLESWRDGARLPGGAAEICPEQDAVAAMGRGLAARRHARRRTALLVAAAAAVLSIAGFGALTGQAEPADPLYGARTTLFGESASVQDERIAVSAESDMDQVEQMIAVGQWEQAHDKLAAVGAHVQTVKDADRKQGLIEHMNRLNAKVVSRDAHATPPPSAPGIVFTPNRIGG